MNRWIRLELLALIAIVGLWGVIKLFDKPKIEQPAADGMLSEKEYLLLHEPAKAIAPFVLTSHEGKAFSNAELKGHWSILFLGYTYCPDICPTTLAMFKSVYDKLSAVEPVQIVFISADPQRDTPERLNQYIHYFHSEFIGATAPHADLYPFTRNLGLAYAMFDGETPETYLVDHSASIVVVNPDGLMAATIKPMPSPHGYVPTVQAAQLLRDYKQLVAEYQP